MFIGVGTVGLQINLAIGRNISGGTASMIIKKPDGVKVTKTVVVDNAAAGNVHYVTVDGDLNTAGTYTVRSKWEPGGSSVMYGAADTFDVERV